MSWEDRRRRRQIVDELLRHADACPDLTTLAELPVAAGLSGPEAVWLALQDRWLTLLTGRLGPALAMADAARDDRVDTVLGTWRDLAAAQSALRRLLDADPADPHPDTPATRAAAHREARLLATSAGLAELGEHPGQVNQIGAALRHLIARPLPARIA